MSPARALRASPRAPRSSSSPPRARRAPWQRTSSRSAAEPRHTERAAPARRGALKPQPFRRRAIAPKEEKIELEGEVVEAFPSGMFKVRLDNGHDALGYTAGKMRR